MQKDGIDLYVLPIHALMFKFLLRLSLQIITGLCGVKKHSAAGNIPNKLCL
jgi:hypothetical protein